MIAALYVDPKGVYSGRPDVECWGLPERDAREYAGPWPVVAHPPCERWSQMNRVNESRWGYRMGEDDGCFLAALDDVRSWGGVLEHPAESIAFQTFGLPTPKPGRWQKTIGGEWVTEVRQTVYGHRATKRTWLVFAGEAPTSLDWREIRGTHQIGGFDVTLPQLPKRERAATTPAFAELLLSMARTAQRQAACLSRP